jgi:DNA repair protein RadD
MILRPYQHNIIGEIRQRLHEGNRAPLVVSPTGSGKTVMFSHIAHGAGQKNKRVWILVHRAELVEQTSRTMREIGIHHGIIAAGWPIDPLPHVQVVSVQTVVRRTGGLIPPDLIIVDECFPAGTDVSGVPIECIQPGDLVAAFNHATGKVEKKTVLGTLHRQYSGDWYHIKTRSGRSFVCTENHPIFVTGLGYISAKYLQSHGLGRELIAYEMPKLRSRKNAKCQTQKARLQILLDCVPNAACETEVSITPTFAASMHTLRKSDCLPYSSRSLGSGKKKASLLLGSVPKGCTQKAIFGNNAQNQSSNEGYNCSSYEGAQSNDESCQHRKNGSSHEGQDISQQGWKRAINPSTTQSAQFNGAANGVCHFAEGSKGEVFEPAEMLQGRPCLSQYQAGIRSRWQESQAQEVEVFGPPQNGNLELDWLDSVEVYQRGSGPRPDWVPESDTVFNIHVESHNNYFANGVLVHNCHHAAAGTWGKILAAFPKAIRLGFTATPERLDGKGLASAFDCMVKGPEVGWLIENQFLTQPKYYAPPNQLNLDGMTVRAGDYAKDEVSAAVDKPSITGDAVSHYRRLCDGLPAVAFCASVAHAEHVAQAFTDAGYRAATIDGTLDRQERRARVRGLADGSIQVLTSCEIISEGFDIPSVTAAILLRPTKSLGMHLQQVGRVLRIAPNKPHAIILDHVGNCLRHGLAEEEREWSLEGRKKRKKKVGDDDDAPPVRQCPKCYACHVPAPHCPECGHTYEMKPREIEQKDGELVELNLAWMAKQRKQEQGQARTFEDLVALGIKRGMKRATVGFWAARIMQARKLKTA